MIRKITGLLNCARGKHHRSEKAVKLRGETYFSRCEYCGTRLRRRAKRDWVVDRAAT